MDQNSVGASHLQPLQTASHAVQAGSGIVQFAIKSLLQFELEASCFILEINNAHCNPLLFDFMYVAGTFRSKGQRSLIQSVSVERYPRQKAETLQ